MLVPPLCRKLLGQIVFGSSSPIHFFGILFFPPPLSLCLFLIIFIQFKPFFLFFVRKWDFPREFGPLGNKFELTTEERRMGEEKCQLSGLAPIFGVGPDRIRKVLISGGGGGEGRSDPLLSPIFLIFIPICSVQQELTIAENTNKGTDGRKEGREELHGSEEGRGRPRLVQSVSTPDRPVHLHPPPPLHLVLLPSTFSSFLLSVPILSASIHPPSTMPPGHPPPLPPHFLLLFLLLFLLPLFPSALHMDFPPAPWDEPQHHPLMGPCLDRGGRPPGIIDRSDRSFPPKLPNRPILRQIETLLQRFQIPNTDQQGVQGNLWTMLIGIGTDQRMRLMIDDLLGLICSIIYFSNG